MVVYASRYMHSYLLTFSVSINRLINYTATTKKTSAYASFYNPGTPSYAASLWRRI